MRMTTCAFICKYYLFFINGEKNEPVKKQLVKRNYHKETLKSPLIWHGQPLSNPFSWLLPD